MRRHLSALLPFLLLAGCASYVGNPADGLGGFLGDSFSWRGNSNRPAVESANARRVMGTAEEAEPLREESGNIWPGPLPPARTMSDLQRGLGSAPAPIDAMPVRGSSTPPAPLPPMLAPRITPQPAPQPAIAALPSARVLQTPAGPATTNIGSNGVETFTLPTGRTGIVMPNANGTLTLIGPDGTTQTIPAPR